MSQERTAFLKVRSALEAHANIAATDIFWGDTQAPEGTRTFAIILEDGGRVENADTPKIGSSVKYFWSSVRLTLLVRVLPGGGTAQTSEDMAITTETTGILDKWAEIESAIGSGTDWNGTTGVPSGYKMHRISAVEAIRVDEYPGWRGRRANIEIQLAE